MISAATTGSGPSAAPILPQPADPSGRASASSAVAFASAKGLAELAFETVAPKLALRAMTKARSAAAKRSAASRSSSAGYAKKTSASTKTSTSSSKKTSSASDPLAFLNDPKLSIEEKLMRLLAQLNARYEEEMQQHMNVLAGKSPAAGKSGAPAGTSSSKKKKGGILGALASVVTKFVPNAGPIVDVLKDKTFQAALKKLGGPVLAAGATALGFPALAPALLKLGPELASGAVGLAKALDAEVKSSPSGAAGSSSADGKSGLSSGDQQLELMELQRLQEKQKEMFSMVSAIFRMQHETRSSIIGNIR